MKSVLITGANRGIGLALCEKFLDLGFKVYGAVRSLERSAVEFEQFSSKNFHPIIMDVSKEESVKEAYATFVAQKEDNEILYIIINNAAARLDWIPNVSHVSSLDIDIEILDEIYRTNVFSAIIVLRTFLPSLQQGARVVNVASGSGEFWDSNAHKDFQIGYAPTKSALLMTTMKLAAAVKNKGIYVNSVCPGWCQTAMGGEGATKSAYDGAKSVLDACFLKCNVPPTGKYWRNGLQIPIDEKNSAKIDKEINCTDKFKKNIYLHIGMPKTATTTIQYFLHENRTVLKEQSFLYPDETIPGSKNHLGIAKSYNDHYLNNIVRSSEYIKRLFDEIENSRCDNIIISAEALSIEENSYIVKLFDKFNVKLIISIRNVYQYLDVWSKEMVKSGQFTVLSHPEFFSDSFSHLYNLVDIYGISNCYVLNYDFLKKNNNVIEKFLEVCGIKYDKNFKFSGNFNVSPSDCALNFLYQLFFLPIGRVNFNKLSKQILAMDLTKFRSFRSLYIDKKLLNNDNFLFSVIKKQSLCLDDEKWIDHCLSFKESIVNRRYKDLPYDIQHYILEQLDNESKSILKKALPSANFSDKSAPFLPSMVDIPHVFEDLLMHLKCGFLEQNNNFLFYSKNYGQLKQNFDSKIEYVNQKVNAKSEKVNCENTILQSVLRLVTKKSLSVSIFCYIRCLIKATFYFTKISNDARRAYLFLSGNCLFDDKFYEEKYFSGRAKPKDCLLHYIIYGEGMGYDPTEWFDTIKYLQKNIDVKESRINAFYHYCKYGVFERRNLK